MKSRVSRPKILRIKFASGGNLDTPFGLCFGPDGNLYVNDVGNASVKRYDGVTGAYIGEFVTSGSGGLLQPNYLVFTPEPSTLLMLGLGAVMVSLHLARLPIAFALRLAIVER